MRGDHGFGKTTAGHFAGNTRREKASFPSEENRAHFITYNRQGKTMECMY